MAPATASSPAWEIRASVADGSGGWLRLGHRAFALRDIVGVAVASPNVPTLDERYVMGGSALLAVAITVQAAVGGAKSIPLAGFGLGVGVLVIGWAELRRRHSTMRHRLEIRLRDGTSAVFATGEPSELRALHAALVQRLSPSSELASA